jgi:hypothetical protein
MHSDFVNFKTNFDDFESQAISVSMSSALMVAPLVSMSPPTAGTQLGAP